MKLDRRMFLRGAGGALLALPFLPSLMTDQEAKAAPPSHPKRFLAIRSEHGGILGKNMYPSDATLTSAQAYAGFDVHRGDLAVSVQGGAASLSPVLTASSGKLTSALAKKMNVIRGLDIPFYIGHHRGGSLGNYSDTDNVEYTSMLRPTLDQVLAYSPKFYGDLSTNLMRSVVVGDNRMSWGYANPMDPMSAVQAINAESSNVNLFNQLYKAPDPGSQRPPIVDRVLEDYKRLRNGNRRLSAQDKQRLDDHLARLAELQRKIGVQVSCGDVMPPTMDSGKMWTDTFFREPMKQTQFWQLLNDAVVAGMICDTTRIATLRVGDTFSDYAGDWHHEIAHLSHDVDPQKTLVASYQSLFENMVLDLITKLDAVDMGDGTTLLDASFLFWTQESGPYTHDPISLPVVTAGGAGGYFKTGNFVDYCNKAVVCHDGKNDSAAEVTHAGLMYSQFLGTVLQGMGLQPADYEEVPGTGYGPPIVESMNEPWYAAYGKYTDKVRKAAGEILPFLKA